MCLLLLLTWSVLIHSFGYYVYFHFLSSVLSFLYGLAVPEPLERERSAYNGVAVLGAISIFIILLSVLCSFGCRRPLTREPLGHFNPVKHVMEVLKCAKHHSHLVF